MKNDHLRALSRQYAAGEIDRKHYLQSRRELLDAIAGAEQQTPAASVPPPPPGRSGRGKSSVRRLFFWLFGFVAALALIAVAWWMPGRDDIRSLAEEERNPTLDLLCAKMWLPPDNDEQFLVQFCLRATEEEILALLAENRELGLKAVRSAADAGVWLLVGRYDSDEAARRSAARLDVMLAPLAGGDQFLRKKVDEPAR
ncbi:MAG: hypothetical protein ACOY4H_02540 [Thermodesulfobacteriota bacterium]